jgi:type 1 glutamine amidotransferase
MRWLFLSAALLAGGLAVADTRANATADQKKRLLLVTHSGGFIHDSVGVAEQVLKQVGPQHGLEVTCYRFTGDPKAQIKVKKNVNGQSTEVETTALEDYREKFRARTGLTVEPENCGHVNKETLKNFDCVLFFTTGNPLTPQEVNDLTEWVNAGGAYAGTHCASDTLYKDAPYGNLVGAYFRTHPAGIQKIRLRVEDPNHPAAKPFTDGMPYEDEMYIFRDAPYNREKLHIILSIDPESFHPAQNAVRKDRDYAVSWCQKVGKGRSFYTSLGHRKEVWRDPHFQEHLINGLKWAMGQLPGDATPSGPKKGE